MMPSKILPITLSFASLFFVDSTLQGQEINAIWSGATGNWNEGRKWSTRPYFPNNTDIQSYSAVIDSGNVTVNQQITLEKLMLGMGGVSTLQGNNNVTVRSDFGLNQGLIGGKATITALGTTTISGTSNLYGGSLILSGHSFWSGRLGVGNASVVDNLPEAVLDLSVGAVCTSYDPDSTNPNGLKRTLNNYGIINANGSGSIPLNITLNSPGTINVNSGSLILSGGGTNSGRINLAKGTTLELGNGTFGSGFGLARTSSISGGGSVNFSSGSNVVVRGVYNIAGSTTVSGTVSFASPTINLGRSLVVNGQFATCDLAFHSVTVSDLNLKAGGALTGSGTVTVNGPFEWKDGSMFGPGSTIAQQGVFFNGSSPFGTLNRSLNCYGSSSVQTTDGYRGDLNFGLNAALNIMPGATFNGSRLMISGSNTSGHNNGVVTNQGTLVIDDPGHSGMAIFGTAFFNQGNIQITNSQLDVRSLTSQPGLVQSAGSIQLNNGTLGTNTMLAGGSLTGSGLVGDIVSDAFIGPAGGSLNFFGGDITLQSHSVLAYTLNGTQPGVSFGDIINVSTATLGGALQVTLSAEFQSLVRPTDTFPVLSAQLINGHFTNAPSGTRLPTADGSGSFLVTYSANQIT